MRILVTGASGLLGLNLCLRLADSHKITGIMNKNPLAGVPFDCVSLDLLNTNALKQSILRRNPELIVHCAAMANVDQCESQPEQAWQINADLPGEIASVCRETGTKFIHISTDAVFDGKMGDYTEEDAPKPLSVYAATKLDGEKIVQKENSDALIARVNFYGCSLSGNRSLAEFFLGNLSKKNQVNGFVDVMFCPLYVNDLVDTLMAMVEKGLNGLYHVVSPECLSKYAFGLKIAEKFGFDKDLIKPVSVNDGNLTARRSPRLSLNIEKLAAEKIIPPGQNDGLEHFHQDYLSGLAEKIQSFAA